LEFWFNRGVAGFRIDVAHGLYKDAELRDNPPLTGDNPLEGRFGLRPVYNANRPETHGVYRDWRKIADSYAPPRLLLGETWVGELDKLAAYYGDNDELQLGFNFPFALRGFRRAQAGEDRGADARGAAAGRVPGVDGSNHDVGRFPTRWCDGDERKIRLALLVLATLPGTTVLYYGDEIGMTDVDVPPALRRDTATLGRRPATTARAGTGPGRRCRGMPLPDGGFTGPGVTPWLPTADPPGQQRRRPARRR
jgi:alpha-glucosidase